MPTTRFDGLPWFEAIVANEVARYKTAIKKEIGETDQVFLKELSHALRAFKSLRQKATSAEEIETIEAAMADVCRGFTGIRLSERARVWATAIEALDC